MGHEECMDHMFDDVPEEQLNEMYAQEYLGKEVMSVTIQTTRFDWLVNPSGHEEVTNAIMQVGWKFLRGERTFNKEDGTTTYILTFERRED